MNPNAFLKSFWRSEFRKTVFVAMSFDARFESRFHDVIKPAAQAVGLEAVRVDESKSGESIITEIVDGIAHCSLFLADVSTVGWDKDSGKAYRNGNVMYEVGLALACRQSSEVLILRNDKEQLLFDTSTVPHMFFDFLHTEAVAKLTDALSARLKERDFVNDVRVKNALKTMVPSERSLLGQFGGTILPSTTLTVEETGLIPVPGLMRLVDKGLITWMKSTGNRQVYRITPLGLAVIQRLNNTTVAVVQRKSESDAAE